ncbi:875_t:CDS:2 [Cetraspora pellucida]|uniref:875_t:CDS:1 n=1 Tax=Cetraspora pellucida TaxID=1433469 RepID=A0ACA9LX15_9GLOM|nr:875_t:CDS:2 [Cetraspora pellucida]
MPDLPKYSETGGYNLGSHNIKSAKLENDKLIIEYNNQQTETKDINDAELQQIKSFSQKLGKSELSLSDLESGSNTGSPDNKRALTAIVFIIAICILIGKKKFLKPNELIMKLAFPPFFKLISKYYNQDKEREKEEKEKNQLEEEKINEEEKNLKSILREQLKGLGEKAELIEANYGEIVEKLRTSNDN